jgi:alkylation response protein AidB-like acyl-CoA dehydrogenase
LSARSIVQGVSQPCPAAHPFAHWYTRVRKMRIYEGASEVQKYQVVARALLHR